MIDFNTNYYPYEVDAMPTPQRRDIREHREAIRERERMISDELPTMKTELAVNLRELANELQRTNDLNEFNAAVNQLWDCCLDAEKIRDDWRGVNL